MTNGPLAAVLRQLRTWVGVQSRASLTDSQLLEEYVLRGEETAFAALVERHAPLVFGVCRRMLSLEEDAADAFQATFLVFARRASSIRRRQSLAAWLYGVARRVSLKARTQTSRRRDASQRLKDATVATTEPDTSEQAAQREARAVLDEELQGLPEKYRMPLILCYFQGRTYEEAAEELGLPSGSMGKRLNQAQDQLRQRLLSRGVTMSAAALAAMLAGSVQAVPPMLTAEAAKAALLFAAGKAGAGAISERVLNLAQGVLHSLWVGKVKAIALAGAAAFVLLGGGTMLITALVPNPPKTQAVTVPGNQEPVALGPKSWQEQSAKSWKGEFITSMAMAPDGKTLAVGKWNGSAVLLDTRNGREVGTIGAKNEPQPTGFPAAGPGIGFGGAPVMNPPAAGGGVGGGGFPGGFQGGGLGVFGNIGGGFGGFGNVSCMAFSRDGKHLATGNASGGIDRWDVATQKAGKPITTGEGNRSIQTLAYSPDGKSMAAAGSVSKGAAGMTGWVKQWDLASGKVLAEYEPVVPSSISSLSFTPDARSIAFVEMQHANLRGVLPNAPVKLLDLKTTKVTWQSDPDTDGAVSLLPDPAGKVLALTTSDGNVRVWNASKGTFGSAFKAENLAPAGIGFGQGSRAVFSPDGKLFASVVANQNGEVLNGQMMMGSNEIQFCDTSTGKVVHRIGLASMFSPTWLVFSGDGQTLAVGGMSMEASDQVADNPFGGVGGVGGVGGIGFAPFGGTMQGEVKIFSLTSARPVPKK